MNPVPTGSFRAVMIDTIATDDSASTVRNKAKAAVIAQGFAVTDDGADAFVADLTMVAPYSVAGMPPGYAMAVSQYGASAFDL